MNLGSYGPFAKSETSQDRHVYTLDIYATLKWIGTKFLIDLLSPGLLVFLRFSGGAVDDTLPSLAGSNSFDGGGGRSSSTITQGTRGETSFYLPDPGKLTNSLVFLSSGVKDMVLHIP